MLIANYCCCPPPGIPASVTDITQGPVPWENLPTNDQVFSLRAGSPLPWEQGGWIFNKDKETGAMDGGLRITGGATIGSFFPGQTVKNVYIIAKLTYDSSIWTGTFTGSLTSATSAPVFANETVGTAAGVASYILIGDYENYNDESPSYRFVIFGTENHARFIDIRVEYIGVDFV